MIKILFICHGNICRSPMAEFVMKDLVKKQHLEHEFSIASAATSMEEIGNDVHRGTKAILNKYHIPYERRAARRMERRDYEEYDYLLGMDSWNIRNMQRIAGGDKEQKIWMLGKFAGEERDIADPWYTGDFQTTYEDILSGCQGLLKYIKKQHHL